MEQLNEKRQQSPWASSITVFLVIIVGFVFIGPFIGLLVAFPFYDGTAFSYLTDLQNPANKPEMRTILLIVQGFATSIGLAVIPAFHWYKSKRQGVADLIGRKNIPAISFLLVLLIVIFFAGFNSLLIEWNANMDLPDFLDAFERYARTMEDRATEMTKYMTSFDSVGQLLLGFLVIVILPSIGEEIAFRGMLQTELNRATKNIHAAIWISSILFSALHLQFFGFIPRVFLGALFGYLYFWSGNLLVPIAAHLVNNGLSFILIAMGTDSIAGMDLENPKAAPWPIVVTFTALTVALIYYFRKIQSPNNATT